MTAEMAKVPPRRAELAQHKREPETGNDANAERGKKDAVAFLIEGVARPRGVVRKIRRRMQFFQKQHQQRLEERVKAQHDPGALAHEDGDEHEDGDVEDEDEHAQDGADVAEGREKFRQQRSQQRSDARDPAGDERIIVGEKVQRSGYAGGGEQADAEVDRDVFAEYDSFCRSIKISLV